MNRHRAEDIVRIARRLAKDAEGLRFRAPSHVYNPLDYAWPPHLEYLRRYGERSGRILLLGMNPGPWGMAQTGVPFGDVVMVREWLGLEAPLRRVLPRQHPRYPILGWVCHRREGSGRRLWSWARERFDTPERFFARFFVWNYCPLLFIANSRNLTPEHLPRKEAEPLAQVCDGALRALLGSLAPTALVGVGRYAERRLREAVGGGMEILYLPHPSPASPAANRNWAQRADKVLGRLSDTISDGVRG